MRILIFVLLGAIAYTQLPVELLPDLERPSVFVVTRWPGVSPEDLEDQVTRPVEDAVATVPGMQLLRSSTSEGSSTVTIEFSPGHDMKQAAIDVLQLVQRAQRSLPNDPTLQAPTVQKNDPNSMPVLVLGVRGIDNPVRLRSVLNDEIKPVLESAEGVATAEINGGQERAIMVQFDDQALLARNLSSEDIVRALNAENQNVPGGTAYEGNQQLLVRSYGWVRNVQELGLIPVGTANNRLIPLKSVARIVDSHREVSNFQRLNGVAAGSISIQKQSGANTIETVNHVMDRLETVARTHPHLEIREVYNQSKFVQQAVHSLQEAAVVGGGLAMLVVFVFLRNWRSTLVIATSIPISIISTFSFIYLWGYSLNTMTLVGLALATGLLVDDAIVVLENIYRLMEEEGLDAREASIKGTGQILSAVISSTLTIMVVFFPLLLIPGQTGQMFKPFALVIIVCLGFSMFDALTGIPMLCSQYLKAPQQGQRGPGWAQSAYHFSGLWLNRLDSRYKSMLGSALERPFRVLLGGLGVTLLSLCLLPWVGYEFAPRSDTGTLRMQINMPRGSSIEETARAVSEIEKILGEHPDVETFLTSVGQSSGGAGGRDRGSAWIALRGQADRASSATVSNQLRSSFSQIPAVRAFPSVMDLVRNSINGGNQGESLELNIYGPDLDLLAEWSRKFLEILTAVPGCEDFRDRAGDPAPEVRWIIDRAKANQLGLSFQQVASALKTAAEGTVAGYLQSGGTRAPIVVQLAQQQRKTIPELRNLMLNTRLTPSVDPGEGRVAPAEGVLVRQVARAEKAMGYATINRMIRQRYAALVGAGQGRAASEIQRDVEEALQGVDLPPGYSWDWSPALKAQQKEFGKLAFAVILAVVLIYMLLCIQFESLIVPLSIMLSVPLCAVGVILGLVLSGTAFSVMAGVGCLMLVGIAVKNGILLIENTIQAREAGRPRLEALIEACPARLRPILITALSAILAMMPIALRGRGGELEAPMAIAVMGGLLASTVLTLLVVPAAYLVLDDLEARWMGGRGGRG